MSCYYLVVFSLLRCIVIKINDSHYNHKVIWDYTAAEWFFRRFAFSWNWERYHKGRLFCNKENLCNGIAKKNQKTKCYRGIGKIVCKQTKNSQRKDQRGIDFFSLQFYMVFHSVFWFWRVFQSYTRWQLKQESEGCWKGYGFKWVIFVDSKFENWICLQTSIYKTASGETAAKR